METSDYVTLWSSTKKDASYTFKAKIITPKPARRSIGNKVVKEVVFFFQKQQEGRQISHYKLTSVHHDVAAALIIEPTVQNMRKNHRQKNLPKLDTIITIKIADDTVEHRKLMENIIGINPREESATAFIFDTSVSPSAFLEKEFGIYWNINNFDLNNV